VLLAVELELPVVLGPEASDVTSPLRFAPATCDPHVLAETKQPFLFPMTVQLGDEEPATLDLPIPDDVRSDLQALVQRVCG
jgi:hypothetical protein